MILIEDEVAHDVVSAIILLKFMVSIKKIIEKSITPHLSSITNSIGNVELVIEGDI